MRAKWIQIAVTTALGLVLSTAEIPAAAGSSTESAAATTEPAEATAAPAVATSEPVSSPSEPAIETTAPNLDNAEPVATSAPAVETSELSETSAPSIETTEPSETTVAAPIGDDDSGPIVALVLDSVVAVGSSLDLSTDPADVDGVDGIADLEAFICCGGEDPTALRPLNGAGFTFAGESWDAASLSAAQADSYSTSPGGFIPSEGGVIYIKTGNDRFYKLRFPTGGTNDTTGISIEWDYLGAGTVPPPTASFTFDSYDVFTSFTDTSTGTPSSWSWTFGDGGTSVFQNPFHSYPGGGTFEACLTATNIGGSDGPVCQDVTITEEPSTTVAEGGSVDFDGDGSPDVRVDAVSGCDDPNALALLNGAQFAFFFGDYRTLDLADAQAASLSTALQFCVTSGTPVSGFFVLTGGGQYVKVWTPSNTASDVRFVFEVLGGTQPPPVASFAFTTYDVFASFTDTSTGGPTNWSWTFGDGGSSNAQNPFHSYAGAGNFEACLTARNGGGSDGPVCQDVTITEESSNTVVAGASIDFDGDGMADLDVDPTTACGAIANRFLVLNGAQVAFFSGEDYRTRALAHAQAASFSVGGAFCVEPGTPFEGFYVLTASGAYFKVWTPSNTSSGVRMIFEQLGEMLTASADCAADGSATVDITAGDPPFDIDFELDGVAQPSLSSVAAGSHLLAGDDPGPNVFTIVVSEVVGDGDVLDLVEIECVAPATNTTTTTSTSTTEPTALPTTTSTTEPTTTTEPRGFPSTPPVGNLVLFVSDTTPSPGQEVELTASGFTAGETLDIVIYSTPMPLAATTADSDGDLSATIVIPADIPLGDHVLAVFGADDIATAAITVVPATAPTTAASAPSDSGTLPRTGTDAVRLIAAIALALLGAGTVITQSVVGRRHQQR